MEHTSRLFSCALCHAQTIVCSVCDRGQIYCGSVCSNAARQKSCKEASHRYQKTFKGKMNNALRQKRYRERLREKVTHHGSKQITPDGLLQLVKSRPQKPAVIQNFEAMKCCFCQVAVPFWIRHGFLRYKNSKKYP
jgi:hypothetical protein